MAATQELICVCKADAASGASDDHAIGIRHAEPAGGGDGAQLSAALHGGAKTALDDAEHAHAQCPSD